MVTALKTELLRLLREDEEFRYAVAGLIGLDAVLNELRRLREDFNAFVKEQEKRWEENNRRWEENNKRWEEAYKRFEAIELELKKLREDFNKLHESVMRRMNSFERKLVALGARWGVESEEAFREGLKAIVESEFGLKIKKWIWRDDEGRVFGYPADIELDVAILNDRVIIVEIKSSVDVEDIYVFNKKTRFYEEVTGERVSRRIIITPFIDNRALEIAQKLGVEVYTNI